AESQRHHREGAVIEVLFHSADVVDREIRIQLAEDAAHGRSERGRVAVRPQVECHRRGVALRERRIEKGTRLFPDHDVFRVAHYADHLPEVAVRAPLEPPTHRILTRPQALGHRGVDDRDLQRGFAVALREVAAAQHGASHRGQVFGGDIVGVYGRETVFIARLLLRRDLRDLEEVAEGHIRGEAGGADPGQFFQAVEQLPVELLLARLVVTLQAEVERRQEQVVGAESEVRARDLLQASHEQPPGDQHYNADRHLRNHQSVAEEVPARAEQGAAALLEYGLKVEPRRAQGGRQARYDACEDGHQEREGEDAPIPGTISADRHIACARGHVGEQIPAPVGEQRADNAGY